MINKFFTVLDRFLYRLLFDLHPMATSQERVRHYLRRTPPPKITLIRGVSDE